MNFKKLLSLLLSVVMVVTLVPFGALAEGEGTATVTTTVSSFTKRGAAYEDFNMPEIAKLKTDMGDGY